jgi:membrane-associated phospholipid phosphatase
MTCTAALGHSDAMSIPRAGRAPGARGILDGARAHNLPTLIVLLLGALVLVEALLLGLGLLITRVLASTSLHRTEAAFERDLAAHRTALWNQVTGFGSALGSTITVIVLTALGCLLLARRGHGPRLPAFLALAVAGESALFLLASLVVDRLRPAVPHLDSAPPTSSFPSGHTAATVALWVGLALGLARTHPRHPLRALSWVLAVALPAFVLFSRLYRGMHWPTDVAASVVFTLVWLLLLRAVLLPPDVADRAATGGAPPPP